MSPRASSSSAALLSWQAAAAEVVAALTAQLLPGHQSELDAGKGKVQTL